MTVLQLGVSGPGVIVPQMGEGDIRGDYSSIGGVTRPTRSTEHNLGQRVIFP